MLRRHVLRRRVLAEQPVEVRLRARRGLLAVVERRDAPGQRFASRGTGPSPPAQQRLLARPPGSGSARRIHSSSSSSGIDIVLPNCSVGGFRDADVVVVRLRHLLLAVGAAQQRHDQQTCGSWP
jgi:hypothetical protein